jgi:hypothetical protein
MAKYEQTNKELRNNLCDQLQFLRASAASFDKGFEGEAKRLATTVRVLVHDTERSKSLLHLLELKQGIGMHNTARPFDSNNLAPHQGLVVMRMEVPPNVGGSLTLTLLGEEQPYTDAPLDKPRAKVTYVPRVHMPDGPWAATRVPFTTWWEEIVIKDRQGNVFTRKDIILAMANKEGGAHVDPELDEAYARLTRFYSQGWQVRTGRIRQPPDNSLVAASIRQIAHEVLVSIEPFLPELCARGGFSPSTNAARDEVVQKSVE